MRHFSILLLLYFCLSGFSSNAKTAIDSSFKSPYHTLFYFLHFQQADQYDLAKSSSALGSTVSGKQREELAYQLKAVLDGNGLFVPMQKVPRDSEYFDTVHNESIYLPFPERLPEVYLEKIGEKWFISEHTLELIPSLYSRTYPYLVLKLLENLPARTSQLFLGVPVWQWVAGLSLMGICLLFFVLLYYLSSFFIHKISEKYIHHLNEREKKKKRLAIYLSLWLSLGLALLFIPAMMLPIKVTAAIIATTKILRTGLLIFVFLKMADILFLYAREYVAKTPGKMDNQILPIIEKAVDFIIILAGILNILHQLDVNITALIAGVSIGGLAIALAAQDTVKNIIGSAMIFVDKPFQIGDFIETSNYSGTVEEVGFRSVRLRNVDRSLISVPNGHVANDTIINLGLRPMRRIQLNIGLTYSTSPQKLETYIHALRQMVERHPSTSKTDFLIHFHSLGASSLDIFFRVYIFASTIAEELKIREELVFGVIQLANAAQVDFAFPSTSLYIEQQNAAEKKPVSMEEIQRNTQTFLDDFEHKLKPPIEEFEDSGT
jgi:MscS family membrane protein